MRAGPSGQEVILTHAVSRLQLSGHVDNIQVSWVKEGFRMAQLLLDCGVNDLGGTLMNESISIAAGAGHGQLATPAELRELIRGAGRVAGMGMTGESDTGLSGSGMRIPVERHTDYTYRRIYSPVKSTEEDHPVTDSSYGLTKEASDRLQSNMKSSVSSITTLDNVTNAAETFGSFDQLRKSPDHRFKSYYRQQQQQPQPQTQKRDFSTVTQRQLPLPHFCNSQKRDLSSRSSSMRDRWNNAAASTSSAFPTASTPAIATRQAMVPAPISSTRMESTPIASHPATIITYSSSYTIVPTYECFNSCLYCNFRINVRGDDSAMLPLDDARTTLQQLQRLGNEDPSKRVDEILILSGEIHPRSARREAWFKHILNLCHLSLEYGFLPHTNAGPLSENEMYQLGQVNASMGLMLEQSNPNLASHRFAPNKVILIIVIKHFNSLITS